METNVIYCGDNVEVLPKYLPNESVDLVYIDPPFNSSRNYEVFWGEASERRAFNDRFGDAMTYLDWMRPRLKELYRVLKPTGSFYYHCDWHASHYIKIELDRLFGFNNFQSEIVWKRTTSHNDSRRFGQVTDSIFYYTKGQQRTWNPVYVAHDPEYVKSKYTYDDGDGRGPYSLGDMNSPNPRPNMMYEWKGHASPKKGWRFDRETMARLDAEGRIWYPKHKINRPRLKRYLSDMKGVVANNLWQDIYPVNSQAEERQGWPTQKPLALMERIIEASSNRGDVVLDAFCGCGTTLEVAAKGYRKWIGIDFSPTACRVMAQRLEKRLALKPDRDFKVHDMPKSPAELKRMPHFEFQNWAVVALGGVPNQVKVNDFGIDGRLYLSDIEKRSQSDGFFEVMDKWYPIQVKQTDQVGRPDIDSFETAMRRDRRLKGYFIGFEFSRGAEQEIQRANKHDGLDIVPVTVDEILRHELAVV